jgi:hypothetical protein
MPVFSMPAAGIPIWRYPMIIGEIDFKRWFRKQVDGWSECVEPGIGSGMGIADLLVLKGKLLLPIELKVGHINKGKLYCRRIRPDQIEWLWRLSKASGDVRLVIGVEDHGKWEAYGTDNCSLSFLSSWRDGWALSEFSRLFSKEDIRKFIHGD